MLAQRPGGRKVAMAENAGRAGPTRAAPRPHPAKSSARRESRSRTELPLVEVDVDVGPSPHWVREVTERWNLRVQIDVCRPMGPTASDLLQIVEMMGDPGDLGSAERYLRHHPEISALTVLSPYPSRRFVRAVSPLPEACRRVFEMGAICGTCRFAPRSEGDPGERWTLVVPRTREALRTVARAQAGPNGSALPFLRMRKFVPARTLTPRQTTALETAYRLGFYAFPRRTNLREIARILGVSRSTTAELLRRAESKMLAHQIGSL